jgi:ribosome-binding factor A
MKVDETPRQRKIAAVLQRELSLMLQEDLRKKGANNIVISITKVSVTVDLSLAKIYISIFPKTETEKHLKSIQENVFQINYEMSSRMKNQLRKMPKFSFFIDDSLDYIEGIEKAISNPDDPILNSSLLTKRQKK